MGKRFSERVSERFTALVVDDTQMILELLSEVLRQRGYEVRTAVDGQQGVDMFREQPCDLIMLDISMPRMDGLEALRRLRAMDAHVGVVVMTGHGGDKERREAERLGAHFITKPFNLTKLDALLTQMEAEPPGVSGWREAEGAAEEGTTTPLPGSPLDRRCHLRGEVNLSAAVMVQTTNGSMTPRSCHVIDLSLGGSRNQFILDRPFPCDTEVNIAFTSIARKDLMTLPAVVVWVDEELSNCGARFLHLDDKQRIAIENLVVEAWQGES